MKSTSLLLPITGWAQVNEENTIFLKDYIQNEWFERIEGYTPNYLFYL